MIQRFRENRRLQGLLLILPAMFVMVTLLVAPLTLTVITSFGQRDADGNVIYTFTLENYWRLMGFTESGWDDLYLRILLRSLWLAVQTTTIVILMAYPLAYFIARSPERRRNLLLFLVLVPLWTNFVIRIYAWVMILRGQGVLNSMLGGVAGLFNAPFQPLDLYPSQTAVLIGMVYEFLPFMILPIYTSLEKIEPNLYEAAADLYANAFRTFWRVTVPLSMPGIVAGTILTFIPVIGTFVVSDILGGRQVILVGNLVQRQFLDARNPPFGAAASIILLVMTLVLTLYYTRRFGLGEEIAAG
ncbi:MAG: ABC transporter permease [Caldilinea sp.]|jgi:spermidine/putrescine transport system permease protein|nr:ABC transporter permease [Caldilinea sp.]